MAYFEKLNNGIFEIIDMLLSNDNLCKYLVNNNFSPLSNENTPIENPRSLIMKNIFPLPKLPDAEENEKCIINVYFYNSKPYKKNSGFRSVDLCFDIICHLNLWQIDSGIRPYAITNEIDKMFNDKIIEQLSMTNIFSDSWRNMKYSDYFYGYNLTYRLSQDSNIAGDCD